jgi:hypothetical protein
MSSAAYGQDRPFYSRFLSEGLITSSDSYVLISIADQRLYVLQNDTLLKDYVISSSAFGTGSASGSKKTPLGLHKVARRIGAGAAVGQVFRARVASHEIATNVLDDPREDIITTRILWLQGLEPGINSGFGVDSYQRKIYIHGTAQEIYLGTPKSHGCIRMKNSDVLAFFNQVKVGTPVFIMEEMYHD